MTESLNKDCWAHLFIKSVISNTWRCQRRGMWCHRLWTTYRFCRTAVEWTRRSCQIIFLIPEQNVMQLSPLSCISSPFLVAISAQLCINALSWEIQLQCSLVAGRENRQNVEYTSVEFKIIPHTRTHQLATSFNSWGASATRHLNKLHGCNLAWRSVHVKKRAKVFDMTFSVAKIDPIS